VQLLVPADRRPRATERVGVTRVAVVPRPVLLDGLPHAPTERAMLDACRHTAEDRSRIAMVAEVVQRRWTTVARLEEACGEGHPAGSGPLRRALAMVAAGARSAPEADLMTLLATSAVLPPGRWNEPLAVGDERLIPDLCRPEARLVIEVDSIEHHGFGPDAEATSRRRSRLVAAGWTVLSVSPQRIRTDGPDLLTEIEHAYLEGIARAAG
jgi:hypothetical protein